MDTTTPTACTASTPIAGGAPSYEELVERNEVLERDVLSLTKQVTNDFEELALLQALAGSLEIQSRATDPFDLAKNFLKLIARPAMAQEIALVLNRECVDDMIGPESGDQIVLWNTKPLLDDATCISITRQLTEHWKSGRIPDGKPWIVTGDKESTFAPNVRDWVVVELYHGNARIGFLAAFNHIVPRHEQPQWAQNGFTSVEASLLMTAASILATQFHNAKLLREKDRLFAEVVRSMVNAVEESNYYARGHSERIALMSKHLAKLLGLNSSYCERIYLTGLLHDVGKIVVPDRVFQKPDRLSDDERQAVQTHTDAGWRILHPLSQLHGILPGVTHHHEHFDGSGYPDGLQGQAIPLDGRIIAVVDAYDAMLSDRPYRKGRTQPQAEETLRKGAGSQWDPELIELFLQHVGDFIEIRQKYVPPAPEIRHGSSDERDR